MLTLRHKFFTLVPGLENRQGTEAIANPQFKIGLQQPDVVFPKLK
jgi:hypothetical protein